MKAAFSPRAWLWLRFAQQISPRLMLLATCGLLLQLPGLAQDANFIAVMKGREFYQASAEMVALGEWQTWYSTDEVQGEGEHAEPVHMFEAFGIESSPGALVSGTLTTPGGGSHDLHDGEYQEDPEIGIESGASSPRELDVLWPDGDYTVTLSGSGGALDPVTLTLAGSTYPPVPKVLNFTALQAANAATTTPVSWSPMGGDTQDFIQLRIVARSGENEGQTIYQTPMPGEAGALNGTATGTVIPAGLLQAGKDYQGEVLFFNTVDLETSPVLSVAGYYKLTGFLIRTNALPGEALGAKFLWASPRNTWSNAPADSTVAFRFSHPMSSSDIAVSWTDDGGPLSGGTFTYQWIRNNTVLLCTYSSALPTESEIGWTLHLSAFRDAAGHPLSGSASGSFRTNADPVSTPPDIDFIGIFKSRYYIQTDDTPVDEGRYEALVEIDANAPNRLISTSVTALPAGPVGPLIADPWDGSEYEAPGEYGSKTDLDRFYPNGFYQFDMVGLADGAQSVTLNLGSIDQYPDAPTVTNLGALQSVDPDAPATITWNAFPGWNNNEATFGPGDGLIELEIVHASGREVVFVDPFELANGTQFEIPAGTLKPGSRYAARIYFMRIVDLDFNSYPDVTAVAAFESQTSFTIMTTGELLLPTVGIQDNGPSIRITTSGGDANEAYRLEASSDTQRWTLLNMNWSDGGSYQYDDVDAPYFKARYYRMTDYDYIESTVPPISIQGRVWTDNSHSTPVAGATVGTSLDGRTTVSDADGRFFLITDTPGQSGSAFYTIHISHGLQSKSFGPWSWGDQPRNQVFAID